MTLVWSPSAVIAARNCPRQWSLGYGPGRLREDRGSLSEAQRLGMVMHSALEVPYRLVRRELLHGHRPGRMSRYLAESIRAMESRWRSLLLPEDETLQVHLIAELGAVLESLPVPHPANVLGVEEQIGFTGSSGTPFKAILDVVVRTGPTSIHIRDWKRKTFDSLPKPEGLLDDVQLCQQRVAAHERWPWADTVTVGLFSTRSCLEAGPVVLPLERAQYRVSGHELTAYRMESSGQHPPMRGPACVSCVFRQGCPAFR